MHWHPQWQFEQPNDQKWCWFYALLLDSPLFFSLFAVTHTWKRLESESQVFNLQVVLIGFMWWLMRDILIVWSIIFFFSSGVGWIGKITLFFISWSYYLSWVLSIEYWVIQISSNLRMIISKGNFDLMVQMKPQENKIISVCG